MIFWSIAIAVTAIACAALFYAGAGRTVNAAGSESSDPNSHFRQLLAGIDADVASGKLDAEQAAAAKGELAREVLRAKSDKPTRTAGDLGRGPLLVGLAAMSILALGLYAVLGSPEMPAQPLAQRPELVAQNITLDDAVAQIEARLAAAPKDVRGWSVIAPAYVEMGRYADAASAYRQVIALSGPTAELQTDLAEALLLAAGGAGSNEAMDLLRSAAQSDAAHVRSRLYLAAELMRLEDYDAAERYWQDTIELAQGDEPWLPAAQEGLAVARADGLNVAADQQAEAIRGMVETLAARLSATGGSVEEWSQLVRSYIVLGEMEQAQAAFDDAVAAYPAAFDRGELDTMALAAGLELNGGTP
jgi:cytochrome c-type biogenesis protein CcmH